MTLHLTSDTIHAKVGTPEAGGSTLVAVPILVIWLYGTLVLAERRSGYMIMLDGSLLVALATGARYNRTSIPGLRGS